MPMYQGNTLALVTRDRKGMVFSRLVPDEQPLLEPVLESLASDAEVRQWQASDASKAENYADERAWDLVAYTLWLRESSRPKQAAIWPKGAKQFSETPGSRE